MPKLTKQLKKLLYVTLFTILWTLIIPGILAHQQNLFYLNQMKGKIPTHSSVAINDYREYESKKNHIEMSLKNIDLIITKNLSGNSTFSDLDELLQAKSSFQAELKSLNEPFVFRPFYGGRIPYYWFVNYFSLLILVFIAAPISYKCVSFKKTILTALILHLLYSSFNYLRNFIFYNEGRVIFSYAHFDISPAGFFLQELQFFGMCFLVAVVWFQWESYFDKASIYTRNWRANQGISLVSLSNSSRYLYSLFLRWQFSSILLTGGFLIWTFHFWNLAFQAGDARYYISAIIMHFFWLVSWVIISRPLILTFSRWSLLKSNMQAILSENPANFKNAEYALKYIDQLNPLTAYQLLGTSIAAIGSFLLPFIDLIRRI